MLYVRELCYTMSNEDSVVHEVGCTEVCGVSPTKNQSGKRPLRGKKSEENLEKDSPYVLLVFAWNQSPHRVGSKVVVQLVDMEKGFVGFPTIA
jgi:hypothetical protein